MATTEVRARELAEDRWATLMVGATPDGEEERTEICGDLGDLLRDLAARMVHGIPKYSADRPEGNERDRYSDLIENLWREITRQMIDFAADIEVQRP